MSRIEQSINQIRRGDFSGVRYLYDNYSNFLLKMAMSSGLRKEDAEEITQNTFLKIIKAIHRFEYRNDNSFLSWMIKIQQNHIREFFRKNKIKIEYIEDEETLIAEHSDFLQDPEDPIPSDPRLEIIKNEINQLSKVDQILLTLRAQEIPYEMIADIIGSNPNALKTRYSRLQKRLIKKLKNIFEQMNLL
ncbi:MAG: sigma-70 family RNA polymerase sigma factor [Calditrichaeota bacterium]|nr:MAG: sigma-70 family RNA polymerase sigma factor [Calditrichota bacterium]